MLYSNKTHIFIFLLFIFFRQLSSSVKSPRNLQTDKKLQTQIFVSSPEYYFYDVYTTSNGSVEIDFLSKDLLYQTITQTVRNPLHFIDAVDDILFFQQRNDTNSFYFWVHKIVKTQSGHMLSSFFVNSTVDNENYTLGQNYKCDGIVEYNKVDQKVYIRLSTKLDANITLDSRVYLIDLQNFTGTLQFIGLFYYNTDPDKRQNIQGGNSRVYVQATDDKFWIDTQNVREKSTDPTIYKKVDIETFTHGVLIFGGSHSYRLRDSYFLYYTRDPDYLNFIFFIYHGYDVLHTVDGQGQISNSNNPVLLLSDKFSYFVAIADVDVYMAIVSYDQTSKVYSVWGGSMSPNVADRDQQSNLISIFNDQAISIVQKDNKLFVLTPNTLYIFDRFTIVWQISFDQMATYQNFEYSTIQHMNEYYKNISST